MQILGITFEIPPWMVVREARTTPDRIRRDINGPGAESLRIAVARQFAEAGFVEREHTETRSELERGEQRVVVILRRDGLTIQVYDPTVLPFARVDGGALVVADLRVQIGASRVVALRETQLPGSPLVQAAWKVYGVPAADCVQRVIDAAVEQKHLRRGAAFPPAKSGREVWTGEAHSERALVKATATVNPDGVLLEIDVVDKR